MAAEDLGRSLARWPIPFPDRSAAITYSGGPSLASEAWTDGLVQDGHGLWPSFDVPVLIQTLRQAVSKSYREEWKSIRCPTLRVRAEHGVIDQKEMEMMADYLPSAKMVQPTNSMNPPLGCSSRWHRWLPDRLLRQGRACEEVGPQDCRRRNGEHL